MTLADARSESRERFLEVLQILNTLSASSFGKESATNIPEKALRGLFLVALYGAFERSANSAVEQAISVISSHRSEGRLCNPRIFTVFLHSKVKSIRGSAGKNLFDRSLELFEAGSSENPMHISDNPLSDILQNVDGKTLISVSGYFGIDNFVIDASSIGRLNNLRERRNAVAHGRESAATAGERFSFAELRIMYSIADREIAKFIDALEFYCEHKKYLALT
jgi:hypothetical protein